MSDIKINPFRNFISLDAVRLFFDIEKERINVRSKTQKGFAYFVLDKDINRDLLNDKIKKSSIIVSYTEKKVNDQSTETLAMDSNLKKMEANPDPELPIKRFVLDLEIAAEDLDQHLPIALKKIAVEHYRSIPFTHNKKECGRLIIVIF